MRLFEYLIRQFVALVTVLYHNNNLMFLTLIYSIYKCISHIVKGNVLNSLETDLHLLNLFSDAAAQICCRHLEALACRLFITAAVSSRHRLGACSLDCCLNLKSWPAVSCQLRDRMHTFTCVTMIQLYIFVVTSARTFPVISIAMYILFRF